MAAATNDRKDAQDLLRDLFHHYFLQSNSHSVSFSLRHDIRKAGRIVEFRVICFLLHVQFIGADTSSGMGRGCIPALLPLEVYLAYENTRR